MRLWIEFAVGVRCWDSFVAGLLWLAWLAGSLSGQLCLWFVRAKECLSRRWQMRGSRCCLPFGELTLEVDAKEDSTRMQIG